MTTTAASAEKYRPEDLATKKEASAGDEEYMTRPRDLRQERRRQGINDRPEGSTMKTEASAEEDEHEDFNNNNGGVGEGQTTRPRDHRQLRRRQRISY